MEKVDKVKMEQAIRALSESLVEYEKEIIFKTDQISSLSLALLKQSQSQDAGDQRGRSENPRLDAMHREMAVYKSELKNMVELNTSLK